MSWRRARLLFVPLVVVVLLAVGYARERPSAPTGRWLAAAGLEPRVLTLAGRQVRVVRRGAGPGVVLLHGFASSIYTWKDVLPVLAQGHDVVALDFPGFGGSEAPRDLSFDEYPRIVIELVDQLGLARATIVGNSMGGAVAAVVAAERPERVERLVLVDAAGFRMQEKSRPWPIRLVGLRPVSALLERLPLRRMLVEASLRQVFFDRRHVTAERIDEYLEPALRPGAPAAIRSLLASRAARPQAVEEALARVSAPTLVVWGREDAWIPVADAERFRAALPGSRVVVLDGCGHLPQEERPAEVARLIAEFLAAPPAAEAVIGHSGDGMERVVDPRHQAGP
jgi:pimeloyl-ACP methyl ester carboxylesterase